MADWFLGHRRLAILDLSVSASQPMCNEDRRRWVVFNGEIYNHRELRHQLASRGHRFATDHSDTEVLLHGHEEWGDDLVTHLRGMFAFGLVDLSAGRVLLARDWFGEKPLYFANDHRGICFASEPRALITCGFASNDITPSGVSDYLTFGYVPAPRTIFSNVRKLRAAGKAIVNLARPESPVVSTYWDLKYKPEPVRDSRAWLDEFDGLLADAVKVRLESDVPLGAFLSGGLDSTSVVQKMSLAGLQPRTFTIAFAEAAFDESGFAGAVAEKFQTLHHVEQVGPRSLRNALEELPLVFDEPFADASAIPMLALARIARKHVAVALSGDGGDELLGGYTRYHLNTKLSPILDGRFGRLAALCGTALKHAWPDDMRGRGLVRLLTRGAHERYRLLVSDHWLAKHTVVGPSDLTPFADAWDERTPGLLNRMCKADLRLYLPEDLMTKVDRTCMAVGLEPRAPFLDRALFEFVAKSPADLKGQAADSKRPLRRSVAETFGHQFAVRDKQGFAVPLGMWFRNELREMVADTLGGSTTFVGRLFPPGFVQNLINAHANGSRDMSARIWSLLVLQRWHERFPGSIANEVAEA
jgi:asparagine synthase (glutamine-hydrolysing)